MKRIEAIVRPERVPNVLAALEKVDHPGLMITEIEGHGKHRGVEQQARGKTYKVELLTKSKIEMVVNDAEAGKLLKVIREAALTGNVGDGKIFVYPVDNVMRIRTAEEGEAAV